MKNWKFIKVGNSDKEFKSEQELRRWAIDHQYTYRPTHGGYYLLEDDSGKGREPLEAHVTAQVENKDTPELREKLRDINEQIKNWEHAKGIDGVEKQNAQKTIDDLRKERSKIQQEIATGNESIDKQTWSMFKGLSKDAEKEVGNANTVSEYNAEIQRLTKKAEQLRRMGQGRSAMEVEKQIEKLGKELRELGNKNVGNTGHWDSKKMIYSKWDDEKGRPSDEYARITWLGEGKGGLAVVWRGTSMTGVKYGSNSLEDLRRWAEEKIGNETAEEKKYGKVMREFDRGELKSSSGETVTNPEQAKAIAYSESKDVNNLKRARNAMTKNAMSIADLEAQIKKNEEYIKSLQGKTVDSEGWSAKASIQEAQDEIDRMKSRIADLKEQGNKKVGNLDTVEEGDYVTVRFQGELVDGVVRKVQGTQALVTIDNTDVWFPIRSLKESI